MSEPYLSEINMFGFNFNPRGWAKCDGQLMPINQNQSLYSLLGTSYGGDGRTSFALPEMRGRTPIHAGGTPGARGGQETVTLSSSHMPSHTHAFVGTPDLGTGNKGEGLLLADAAVNSGVDETTYVAPASLVALKADGLGNTGSGQAHENMQPSLVINFCIALQGLFPSRN